WRAPAARAARRGRLRRGPAAAHHRDRPRHELHALSVVPLALRLRVSRRHRADSNDPGTYDAAYLIAYAVIALCAKDVTGASLADALRRTVPPGPRVDVGPNAINDAVMSLRSGTNIDFNGASGPLDFDVATGDAEADIQVWCLDVDATGKATSFKDSGLY